MTVVGYLKVSRPPLLLLGVIASLGLLNWSGHLYADSLRALLIVLTVACANLGWTLVNECTDIETDKINKKWKPLPSGEVSEERVKHLYSIILGISFFTNACLFAFFGWVYLIGLIGHITSLVYNVVNKGLFGNICMATTYGVGVFLSLYPNHLLFSLPFALFTLAHNLNNQYQDWKAEQTAGVVTVPQQLGSEKTYCFTWGVLAFALVLFFHIYRRTGYLPLLIFLAVTVTTMISTFSMLMEPEKAHRIIENVARRLGRFLLIIGFLAMLL